MPSDVGLEISAAAIDRPSAFGASTARNGQTVRGGSNGRNGTIGSRGRAGRERIRVNGNSRRVHNDTGGVAAAVAAAAAAAAAARAGGGMGFGDSRWTPPITYLHVYECPEFSVRV